MHEPPSPADDLAETHVRCLRCGYNLTGVTIGSPCPECGERVAPIDVRPASGYAVASMVLGIISIPGCFACGVPSLICGTLAIIFWFVARREIATGQCSSGSAGMALAGLITGIIGVSLFLLLVMLSIADGIEFSF